MARPAVEWQATGLPPCFAYAACQCSGPYSHTMPWNQSLCLSPVVAALAQPGSTEHLVCNLLLAAQDVCQTCCAGAVCKTGLGLTCSGTLNKCIASQSGTGVALDNTNNGTAANTEQGTDLKKTANKAVVFVAPGDACSGAVSISKVGPGGGVSAIPSTAASICIHGSSACPSACGPCLPSRTLHCPCKAAHVAALSTTTPSSACAAVRRR